MPDREAFPQVRIHKSHRASLCLQEAPLLMNTASTAVLAPVMNVHIQMLLVLTQFLYYRVLLQEGMNTSGISLTKSSRDTIAIVEREQQETGAMKCH